MNDTDLEAVETLLSFSRAGRQQSQDDLSDQESSSSSTVLCWDESSQEAHRDHLRPAKVSNR